MPDQDALDMAQVQRGNRECFKHLVARHQSALFRYAQSKLGGRSLAEDAVQETFLAAYASRHAFDLAGNFRGWLWTIMVNSCRRLGRLDQRHDRTRIPLVEGQAIAGSAADATAELERAEQRELLASRLGAIPEAQADAIRMRFFGELAFEEIAEVMGCPTATVKSRVRYGLTNLSTLLRQAEEKSTP
ncbi:ECF RNA polymerase sigma factor SigW [Planctomycetes bacterium Pan216]|uniref:ECF RNA polymerase sigma factor SigW n=1 Tax=Kolteria novifilia TaxID=2527975 RepID=A0A518B9A7_9BACT|nr:ECF RNA polymerase sigma factor SigW [Planctomycetes bacterium Pan216]